MATRPSARSVMNLSGVPGGKFRSRSRMRGCKAVRRNIERFPDDFMFQLTSEEARSLRSQIVTSNVGRGGRRYFPHAFTEQGVAMLSSVLRSRRAVQVNVEVMRAFVRLRQMVQNNDELSRRLTTLERKYDAQFKVVFDAIRELMTAPANTKKRIGFRTDGGR